jgi:N-acetylglucosaminylphosphatidylinositol deacetylase
MTFAVEDSDRNQSVSNNEATAASIIHVLVIAHPDDESLFFMPWIMSTMQQTIATSCKVAVVWLLCLTTGNYDGLGTIRTRELNAVATTLLGLNKVIILDEPNIVPDHPKTRWDIPVVADRIHMALAAALRDEYGYEDTSSSSQLDLLPELLNLVTFDEVGVSGHVNHRDTFLAVQRVHQFQHHQQSSRSAESQQLYNHHRLASSVTAWSLETINNPITKYVPIREWIQLIMHWCGWLPSSLHDSEPLVNRSDDANKSSRKSYRLLQPSLNWKAMSMHQSQFVWYRRLFVVFSQYTYLNQLHRMANTTVTNFTYNNLTSQEHNKEL